MSDEDLNKQEFKSMEEYIFALEKEILSLKGEIYSLQSEIALNELYGTKKSKDDIAYEYGLKD